VSLHGKERDMRVINLGGATQNTFGRDSWLAMWEAFSGQNAFMCFVKGCINRPSVGGHVQKDSPADKSLYVIPLCADCSKKKGQDLDIWDGANLVSKSACEATGKQREKPRGLAHVWA
jgi:hypothetical protein